MARFLSPTRAPYPAERGPDEESVKGRAVSACLRFVSSPHRC